MTKMNRQELIERLVKCFFEDEKELNLMTTEELENFLQNREYDCPDLYPGGRD